MNELTNHYATIAAIVDGLRAERDALRNTRCERHKMESAVAACLVCLTVERDRYRAALEEVADDDDQHALRREPTYSDPCLHGRDCRNDCLPCVARKALGQSNERRQAE